MKKNNNIIVINGRHYDAITGELLADAAPQSGQPVQSAPVSRPAPEPRQPAVEPAAHTAAHKPVKHLAAHQPKSSRTLMRQAVKKPVNDSSRRIKAQGRLDGSAHRATSSRLLTRSTARQPDTQRLQNPATKRPKGRLISHFSPELSAVDKHTPAATYGMAPVKYTAVHVPDRVGLAASERPRSTAELLDYAVQQAAVPSPQQPHHHRRRHILKRRTHV